MSSHDLSVRYLEIDPVDTLKTSLVANGISVFNSNVNISNNSNIVLSNINGSTIGTDSTQKLSFYGVRPTSQFNISGEILGAELSPSFPDPLIDVLYVQSTFSGNTENSTSSYTINDIVKALKEIVILQN